jgi:tripartite ATP-independent transporter DctP family solute receptor
MSLISRRTLLATAASLPLVAINRRPAWAAEFSYKMAHNTATTHPLHIRATEAANRVKEATSGRVEITVFPNSQLGSDTDTLSQLRSGAVEMFTLSGLILSTLVPVAAINGIGFAFKDYDQVWAAMDGKLGALVRSEIAKRGLYGFSKIWDNGYRQITSATKPILTPDDLKGFKIRVPVAPLWTGMFSAFGASPTSINFSEVYSALQTHIVDGQENPLAIIDSGKLYEVQKYLSVTNHMWDGFWLLGNKRAMDALPPADRVIVEREFDRAGVEERADVAGLNATLTASLTAHGLQFSKTDPVAFRAALKQAGFYSEWRGKFGPEAWDTLEATVGSLA